MRGVPGPDGARDPPQALIFHPAGRYNPLVEGRPGDLGPPATNYTVENLRPFKEYEFQVVCENSRGKAASVWVTARTGEAG